MTKLHYLDQGSGPAILWIHGFPLSSAIYQPQLSIAGYRHIIPDLPGFGGSPDPVGRVSMDTYAAAVMEILDTMNVPTVTVAGLSMGGYIVFALARKYLARLRGLILIDTREAPDTAEARRKRFDLMDAVDREGVSAVVADMLPKLLSEKAPGEMVRQVEGIIRTSTPSGVKAALKAMADRPDSTNLLPSLRLPTMIAVGSEDRITPVADAQRMAKAIPGSTLKVVNGAGHLSNFERPERFNSTVGEFLHSVRER